MLAESERESGVAATPYPIGSMSSQSPRWKKKVEEGSIEVTEVPPPPPISRELKRRMAHFIQKVDGTDPLVQPSDHRLCPLRRSTTITAFLPEELLSAQDPIQ